MSRVDIPNIFILLLLCIGVTLLQIYLSKNEAKWPGLIIPSLSFIYSIAVVVAILSYAFFGDHRDAPINSILPAILLFVYANIPTTISLLIYSKYRKKMKKSKELDQMNIQDLN